MAAIMTKWGGASADSKMSFVWEMLRYKYPDIRVHIEPFNPGDYIEFVVEGVGRLRLSNTELAVDSPQTLAAKFENFLGFKFRR